MPQFSRASRQQLATCHPDIRRVCEELIKTVDFAVTCGHRNRQDQNRALAEGKSRLRWPLSAHNKLPSEAVDLVPYPVDWQDIGRFKELACAFMAVANLLYELGIIHSRFVWGGTWETFKDYPHYEVRAAPVHARQER